MEVYQRSFPQETARRAATSAPTEGFGPITVERRHIGVKLPILGEINKEAGSPIGLYAILYAFLLYLELLILVYIKSSSCSQEEQLR